MTLLLTVFAAIAATIVWYFNEKRGELRLGFLTLMFWGASLMWLVDAIFEYAELGAAFFTPSGSEMLNDSYLGLSAIALGLMIWLVSLLISDPKGILQKALRK